MKTSLLLIAVALLIGGCRPYHMYAGGARAPSERSDVRAGNGITLLTIDRRDTGISHEFYLEPGPHRFEVEFETLRSGREYHRRTLKLPGVCILEAATEPGGSYVVEGRSDGGSAWTTWLRAVGPDAPIVSCSVR